MIDITKKHTYNGKPVRIYADGSDTYVNALHGAIKDSDGWVSCSFKEEELVEVWQPKEGELVYLWDNYAEHIVIAKCGFHYRTGEVCIGLSDGGGGKTYQHCAPFTGELPEAFKGL